MHRMHRMDDSNSSEEGFFDAVESIAEIEDIADTDIHKSKKDVGDFRRGEELKEGLTLTRLTPTVGVGITKGSIASHSHRSSGSASMRALLDEEVELKRVYSTKAVDPVKAPSESPKAPPEKSMKKIESITMEKVRNAKSFILSSKFKESIKIKDSGGSDDDDDDDDNDNESDSDQISSPRKRGPAQRRRLQSAPNSASPQNSVPVTNVKQKNGEKNMLLVTALHAAHHGPIWAMTFSIDCKFMATAGEDQSICIWEVNPSNHPPDSTLDDDPFIASSADVTPPLGLEVQLFSRNPVLIFDEVQNKILNI